MNEKNKKSLEYFKELLSNISYQKSLIDSKINCDEISLNEFYDKNKLLDYEKESERLECIIFSLKDYLEYLNKN